MYSGQTNDEVLNVFFPASQARPEGGARAEKEIGEEV